MGARPYDPSLGRFVAVDPVEGGSLNNYDYAGQDPINGYDLDGSFYCAPWQWKCIKKVGVNYIVPAAAIGGAIVGGAACVATVICGVAVGATAGAVLGGSAAALAVDLQAHKSTAHTVVDVVEEAASEGTGDTGDDVDEAFDKFNREHHVRGYRWWK